MEDFTEVDFIKLVAAGMLLSFVLAASIVLFVLIYQRKLSRQLLKMQRMKLEHQEVLIQSSIQVADKEKKQFASNLHDVIGAQVAIAKITLSSVDAPSEVNQTIVSQTMELLDGISDSVRSISYNIMPPVLIKLGLAKAIEDYVRKLPQNEITISANCTIEERRFESNIELHAFRVFQEAVTNSIKYANCTRISIELQATEGELFRLSISDDGQGFETKDQVGSGTLNMQHRANLMNFNFDLTSDNSGTNIVLTPKLKLE